MTFLPGLELSRRFHDEVVAPVLRVRFPGLRYAAARMDTGSELLGFDTPRSQDHDWGPRVQLFLDRGDPELTRSVLAVLAAELPATFLGHPTRFARDRDRSLGVPATDGDRHGVSVVELAGWCADTLGFDPRRGVTELDWLATPTQRLAEFTGGAVFHDGLDGALLVARERLSWYPDDIWRYVLSGQWSRIAQEEPFVGRCGEVGDELGGVVVAARLVRDLMRLGLLLARHYPPYAKWLGSAFARLPDNGELATILGTALTAAHWRAREDRLCRAYEILAERTNTIGLAEPVEPTVRRFHDRPFLVLDAGRLATALRAAVVAPGLRRLPPLGAVDQYLDNTGLLARVDRTRDVVATALAR